ncbi:n-acetylglucosamine-6-sulfatase-like protein [Lasius niger]|uniref:N-acetylglucosamine-6-sulfatase-like protein n=1 Tax=Lasius niger TaxID=67767 RepID=A0A0J7L0N2_LASNI|nr:n-acetylglucosamine-6-sulfatase-like protein [Lasius niger]
MINTLNLIASQGATFTNCFVASPICCPNRASILTGRYQHNHLTVNNSIAGGCSSAQWQQSQEPATFAALLRNAGYRTFYAGKYLNEYGSEKVGGAAHVPVGWDWWAGLIGNSKYYDYSLSINGTEIKYGNNSSDYLTDVISNLAVDFINGYSDDQPFLMVLAPPAPHAPFTPADRHNDKYNDTKAKRTPNFNVPVQLCMKEMACKCQDAANNTFSCVRRVSSRFNNIFCIFEDDQRFIEAYNMNVDEYQMTNIGYTMNKGLRYRSIKRLKRMAVCRDAECVFTHRIAKEI